MNRRADFTRAPAAGTDLRAVVKDALSWALPEEALAHVDLHVVAGDLINLVAERDIRLTASADDASSGREHTEGEPHEYRISCRVCGEQGTVRLSIEPQVVLSGSSGVGGSDG